MAASVPASQGVSQPPTQPAAQQQAQWRPPPQQQRFTGPSQRRYRHHNLTTRWPNPAAGSTANPTETAADSQAGPAATAFAHSSVASPSDPRGSRQDYHNAHARQQFQPQPDGRPRPAWKPTPQRQTVSTATARNMSRQHLFLDTMAAEAELGSRMSERERSEKMGFRTLLQNTLRKGLRAEFPDLDFDIELRCFGSFASGFAVAGSDMDLSFIVTGIDSEKVSSEPLARLLEKVLLNENVGARLIDKTRIPVLKVCGTPDERLLAALREERARFEAEEADRQKKQDGEPAAAAAAPASSTATPAASPTNYQPEQHPGRPAPTEPHPGRPAQTEPHHWVRERPSTPLDFPSDGAGVLCDINFSNQLALENTTLLRCYSYCDSRVGVIVRFIKTWAKRRKINAPYSGTLCTYGYVLMVIHYLTNVVSPPVLFNLQTPVHPAVSLDRVNDRVTIDGHDATFYRDERRLRSLAESGQITLNTASVGALIMGFFFYYAHPVSAEVGNGFGWVKDVVSIRTPRGILLKTQKNWMMASTAMQNDTAVRSRYLLAIEDPFETGHNVARTVSYPGMMAIRTEFKRACWIIRGIGLDRDTSEMEGLLDVLDESAGSYHRQNCREWHSEPRSSMHVPRATPSLPASTAPVQPVLAGSSPAEGEAGQPVSGSPVLEGGNRDAGPTTTTTATTDHTTSDASPVKTEYVFFSAEKPIELPAEHERDAGRTRSNARRGRGKRTGPAQDGTKSVTPMPTPKSTPKSTPTKRSTIVSGPGSEAQMGDNVVDLEGGIEPPKKFVFLRSTNPSRRFKPAPDYQQYIDQTSSKRSSNRYPYTVPNAQVSTAHSVSRGRKSVHVRFAKLPDKGADKPGGPSGKNGGSGGPTPKPFNPVRTNWKPDPELSGLAGPGSGSSAGSGEDLAVEDPGWS